MGPKRNPNPALLVEIRKKFYFRRKLIFARYFFLYRIMRFANLADQKYAEAVFKPTIQQEKTCYTTLKAKTTLSPRCLKRPAASKQSRNLPDSSVVNYCLTSTTSRAGSYPRYVYSIYFIVNYSHFIIHTHSWICSINYFIAYTGAVFCVKKLRTRQFAETLILKLMDSLVKTFIYLRKIFVAGSGFIFILRHSVLVLKI